MSGTERTELQELVDAMLKLHAWQSELLARAATLVEVHSPSRRPAARRGEGATRSRIPSGARKRQGKSGDSRPGHP